MFKVSKQNINLNIFNLYKLTASIREWCGDILFQDMIKHEIQF